MNCQMELRRKTHTRTKPSTLLFVHIPKTAGTTFQSVLSQMYDDYDHCTVYPAWQQAKDVIKSITWNGRLRAVAGHFPYGLHLEAEIQPFIESDVRYATFLRDPVRRVVSHYNHVMNSDHPSHREILGRHPTLESFLEHPWARDVQTLFVSGWKPEDVARAPGRAANASIEILRDRFEVVGLTERFDESLALFAEAFGWRLPEYTSMNLASERIRRLRVEELAPSLIDRIKAANRCDVAIYEYASSLFDERCSETRSSHYRDRPARGRRRE
ncbi:sulfotransferase family 2 domain-containing protein [Paludisphaera borealis]|uniref:Sulfotransferase family protein n=1 Tax=Paludisphaera borealis TaxID=1387353 RepID=A0A1U7CUV1_9BACT|nr:sulfotransferase family 2 domain-containing protein [Paludisphaera borealis]APW62676.1 hypothetical protein BSF38_04226 [Paludisphaera borealis]